MLCRSCFGKILLVRSTSSVTSFSDLFHTMHLFVPRRLLLHLKRLLLRRVAIEGASYSGRLCGENVGSTVSNNEMERRAGWRLVLENRGKHSRNKESSEGFLICIGPAYLCTRLHLDRTLVVRLSPVAA